MMWCLNGKPLTLPGFDLSAIRLGIQGDCSLEHITKPRRDLNKYYLPEKQVDVKLHESELSNLFNVLIARPTNSHVGLRDKTHCDLSQLTCSNRGGKVQHTRPDSKDEQLTRDLTLAGINKLSNKARQGAYIDKENQTTDHATNYSSAVRRKEYESNVRRSSDCSPRIRGRPSSSLIEALKKQTPYSRFQCNVCKRPFPRKKSLDAHMLVHNNKRPFTCDFPGCGKAFRQSGQLKTHKRLHTKERPFQCSVNGCKQTFTHANRRCWHHRDAPLKRINSSNEMDIETICKTLLQEELHKSRNNGLQSPDQKELKQQIRSWLTRNIEDLSSEGVKVDNMDGDDSVFVDECDSSDKQNELLLFTEQKRRMEGALALIELLNTF